jgi:multidrug efflux pump subunit AcrB
VDPPDRTAFVNGKPAIVLAITMTPESNVLDFAPRVRSELETIETELPAGFTIEILTYQADQVASAVYGVSINVLQTLAIVLVVVIVFLGLRTGLIVGSIVPGVMLATIAVMGFLDLPIERMSLATLVIALGLLVDNGIVIAEDFKRRLEEGYSRQEALSIGGRELAAPLLISSLTTILVFIPLMLADHSSGEYTRSISLLILISLLTSWVFALMVTPLLCHAFIKEPAGSDSARSGNAGNAGQPASDGLSGWLFNTMNSLYERGLRAMMRMRAVFLAVIGLAMAAAAFGMSQAPQSFFPNSDRTEILVYLDLPADASPRRTDVLVQSVLQTLDDNERFPYLETTAGYAGFGGPRFVLSLTPIDPEPNKAFLVLNVDRRENLEPAQRDIRQMLAEDYPEAWASVTDMFLGPSDSRILEIQAIGPDPSVILDAGEEIAAAIDAIPNTRDIRSNWATPTVNLNVQIDQARARRANVSTVEIAQALSTFFDGQPVSRLYDGDEIVPITMRAQDSERFEPERLESLAIRSPAGGSVLLGEVAEIEVTSVLSRIHREDLVRTLTVEARHDTLTAEELAPMLSDDLKAINADLPPNHRVEVDGIVVDAQEGRSALAANIPLALGLIVLLLVIQFRSYRRPAIILLTIPLILIGAVVGLYALQADFGFMPLLGMYALAGIIVNNAIVLIDRIDIERGETPDDEFDAIIRASVRRFRPILMTTLTTLAGLSPLIIAQDVLFYGMAAVISGGLLVGTVLTLGVVPVLYSYFFRINANRRTTRADESAGPA